MKSQKRHPLAPAVALALILSSCSAPYTMGEFATLAREAYREQKEARALEREEREHRFDRLIEEGSVANGMTMKQVRESYGSPDGSNHVLLEKWGGVMSQWIYPGRREYVYFINGKVSGTGRMPDPDRNMLRSSGRSR